MKKSNINSIRVYAVGRHTTHNICVTGAVRKVSSPVEVGKCPPAVDCIVVAAVGESSSVKILSLKIRPDTMEK